MFYAETKRSYGWKLCRESVEKLVNDRCAELLAGRGSDQDPEFNSSLDTWIDVLDQRLEREIDDESAAAARQHADATLRTMLTEMLGQSRRRHRRQSTEDDDDVDSDSKRPRQRRRTANIDP